MDIFDQFIFYLILLGTGVRSIDINSYPEEYTFDFLKSFGHPLDPLAPDEIRTTSRLIRRHNSSATWIFNRINLYEPEKALLLPFYLRNEPPRNIPRKAFAVIINSVTYSAVEVIVNLSNQRIESWEDLRGTLQPATNRPDRNLAEEIVLNDTLVQERCRQLGWSNMSLVAGDVWPMGYIGDRADLDPTNRLVQSFFYGKMFEADNEYAHPFDFVATIDIKNRRVLSIEDLPTCDPSNECTGKTWVPRETRNYDYRLGGGTSFLRSDLKPVTVSQRGGSSFTVKGQLVQWQKFQFRIGFNEREGLIIHQVGYLDNASRKDHFGTMRNTKIFRSLFYRLSLSETFIPYGEARPPFHRKGAYDMGELDLGISANELNSEEYCLGNHVKFFDAFINDPNGEPILLRRAICIYEDDNGILWKHTDYRTKRSSSVRSQRLNVAFMTTVGNYDYLFTWHFNLDGSIQHEVRLTGILSTNLMAPGNTAQEHGTIVSPQITAQYHQHIFAVRIDPEIDGNCNSVGTLDVIPSPSEYGQAFTTKLTTFHTAEDSKTYGSPLKSRTWLMSSSNNQTRNPYTKSQTAYKLVPKQYSRFLVYPESPLYPKSEFSEYDVWVTPYRDGQLYAGGRYLNNSGLPQWVRESGESPIEDKDVVLWHIFRIDHVPRVEDFPVMPNEASGFSLHPFNFFNENPALDIPPPSRSS